MASLLIVVRPFPVIVPMQRNLRQFLSLIDKRKALGWGELGTLWGRNFGQGALSPKCVACHGVDGTKVAEFLVECGP